MSIESNIQAIKDSKVGLDARKPISEVLTELNETSITDIFSMFLSTTPLAEKDLVIRSKIDEDGPNTEANLVTKIAPHVFDGQLFSSITIPHTVRSIGYRAFDSCWLLKDVIFETKEGSTALYRIEDYAFRQCPELGDIVIPNINEGNFGEGVFQFSGIKSIDLSSCSSLKKLPVNVFRQCTKLASAILPNSVISIGSYAFAKCSALNTIHDPSVTSTRTIPHVQTIGDHAFMECTGLESLSAQSAISIGNQAFKGCTSFTTYLGNKAMTSIGAEAFLDCAEMKLFQVSGTTAPTTNIGVRAFKNCSKLQYVSIGDAVKSLNESVFENCSSLVGFGSVNAVVVYVASTLTFGPSAFKNSGVTTIAYDGSSRSTSAPIAFGKSCFEGTQLKSFTCNKYIASIGEACFKDCKALKSLTFNTSNTTLAIGNGAFSGCDAITSFSAASNSIKTIGIAAFENCTGLKTLTLPSGLTTIGELAFSGCTSLTSVTIPSTVTSIGQNAFNGVPSTCTITCEFPQNSPAAANRPWGSSARIVFQS